MSGSRGDEASGFTLSLLGDVLGEGDDGGDGVGFPVPMLISIAAPTDVLVRISVVSLEESYTARAENSNGSSP